MKLLICRKPTVYIASPYTAGDPTINVRFQCQVFDELLSSGLVLPVAPLWANTQHMIFPRPYQDWVQYDLDMLPLYDCCLRLNVTHEPIGYEESKSSGADGEVEEFKKMGKPVFYSIDDLYEWARMLTFENL